MRIVLLGGNSPNQKVLACKIAEKFELAGIVIEQKISPFPTLKELWEELRFVQIDNALMKAGQKLSKNYKEFPEIPLLRVRNINDAEVLFFVRNLHADIILVSGTSLIKSELLQEHFSRGILNWHPGIVPFVRGNPEPTHWCLAENKPHLIGNSILWLTKGVDSGEILCSATARFFQEKTLSDVYQTVWQEGQELCLNALKYLQNSSPPFQKIPQTYIGLAQTYTKKMWKKEQKIALLQNVYQRKIIEKITQKEFQDQQNTVPTVALPSL